MVIGGTGVIGSRIVAEASARGHAVTSLSRNQPLAPVPDTEYIADDIQDASVLRRVVGDADVVVSALSPRAGMEGNTAPVLRCIADHARVSGTRLGVVGGVAPGHPEGSRGHPEGSPGQSAESTQEWLEMDAVLYDLLDTPEDLDWFYVSPPTDSDLDDLAKSIVDEITEPVHHRARVTFGG
nr:NAD(P)H-binding protein [Brevibacterium yomogidense]